MAVRKELILDTTAARRQAIELERILDQAVRDLKVTFDRSAIQGLERQLAALRVDLDDSGAVRLRDGIREAARAGRDLQTRMDGTDDELRDAALSANRLEDNLAHASGELREGERLASRLDDELDQAASAAGRTATAVGTISARGLPAAVTQAGGLGNALLLAQSAALQTQRNLSGLERPAVAARGLSESMGRLRATMITTPDIARTLGLNQGTVSAAAGLKTALLPLAGIAIAAGLGFRALARDIQENTLAASALAESTSKAQVVFGDQLRNVRRDLGITTDTVLLSEQKALEAVSTFGNMFQALGSTRDEAANLSPVVVQLAADLASFNNINLDDALLALRSGLVGEIEPLRRLGISFNAADVERKALELGLADLNGEISEGAKVQARLALILGQTSSAQGDVARTADGYANTQRRVQAINEQINAQIGTQLIPGQLKLLSVQERLAPAAREFGLAVASAFDSAAGAVATFPIDQLDNIIRQVQIFGTSLFVPPEFDPAARSVLVAVEGIDQALSDGVEPALAFQKGIETIALTGPVTAEAIARLNDFTKLTPDLLRDAAQAALEHAIASGQDEAAILQLRSALALLNDQTNEFAGSGPIRGRTARTRLFTDLSKGAAVFVTDLRIASTTTRDFENDLQTLSDAGLDALVAKLRTLGPEAVRLAEELAADLTLAGTAEEFLAPALDIPALLDQIATDSAAAGDRVREAINPFEGAAEQIKISAAEFTANVQAQIEQQAQLEAGTAFLEALGFDKLADSLRAEGPGAITAMQTFLNDVAAAGEAEALFETLATDQVTAYSDQVKAGLIAAGVDPELIAAISTTIDNPTVRAAFEGAAGGAVSGLGDALIASITGNLQPSIDAAFGIFKAPDLGALFGETEDVGDSIAAMFAADDALNNVLIDEAGLAVETYERSLRNRLRADEDNITGDIAETIGARFASDDALTNAALAGEENFDSFTQGIRSRVTARDWGIEGDLADSIASAFANEDALAEAQAAGKAIADAFEKGTRLGLGMSSPSRVMIQIAREALSAFRETVEADLGRGLNVRMPVSGGLVGAPVAGGGGNVSLTVIGGGNDTSRSATRAAVHAQQVSSLLGIVQR